MREVMTKSMARNIFYGGSLFFILIFVGLTAHSHRYIVTQSTDVAGLTESVKLGKHVWEKHACINCHTILGEGAYFAPELANVMTRWGVETSDEGYDALKNWMQSMPTGIEGRRQMPRFDLTEEEYRGLADFLLWTDAIRAQDWPPNDAG
ncbi:nitric oxide reductase, NorC subunit apoprotein [Thalassovita litoralis]|jgi:nitric oxide reductase subunit C|uniref:Nitric oxide reductase, NorC subunit apoprotein n=1 Tax=Thalassovita litoralis TaxID=1010611 RepID=A0A521ACW2_9RHOB|nr:cytochrome c [Thalassovita litoralis]SMO32653.1 nitric oxide reductase, NorC subunit apoprotein [Thalassovita litoralis]